MRRVVGVVFVGGFTAFGCGDFAVESEGTGEADGLAVDAGDASRAEIGPDVPPPIADLDDDGVPDGADNCPSVANARQDDSDRDGVGDLYEPDAEHSIDVGSLDGAPVDTGSRDARQPDAAEGEDVRFMPDDGGQPDAAGPDARPLGDAQPDDPIPDAAAADASPPDAREPDACADGETCNGVDDDCDGDVDEGAPNVVDALGIVWICQRGGPFSMGHAGGVEDEQPEIEMLLRSYWIAGTEATVAQYRACVEADACTEPADGARCNWNRAGAEQDPINCVTIDQAEAFARWAGARLPSEAEWEHAARGDRDAATGLYPWGAEAPDCDRAVMRIGESDGCGRGTTWPVCSKPPGNTTAGACDMAGNVWEFVADWYGPYAATPRDGSPRIDPTGQRLTRGGAFVDGEGRTRTAARTWIMPNDLAPQIGIRLARDAR